MEKDLNKDIEEIQKKVNIMRNQKKEFENRKKKLEGFKGLLYEQGKFGLEPLVREALTILGFNVLDPSEYSEDYDIYIKGEEIQIIGEVEGTIGPVDVTKLRQLHDYVSVVLLDKDTECKGILIGNGYIEKSPTERPEQFTPHAIRRCKKFGYTWMTTYELFKAVRAVMSDPDNKKLIQSIKEQIIKCEGEFKFKET